MKFEITQTESEVPIWRKVSLTIEEAAAYSGIGINRLQTVTNNPDCEFVFRVGKRKLIKRAEFEKFISEVVEF